jgi:hypothetical protein
MQPHEGPRRDRGPDEKSRQRALTRRLVLAIVVLLGLLAAVLVARGI